MDGHHVHVDCHVLDTNNGQDHLRLTAFAGDAPVHEAVISASSAQDFTAFCAGAAQAAGVDLLQIEQQVAELVTSHRRMLATYGHFQKFATKGFLAGVIDSATFATTEYPRSWLVNHVVVQGQPVILAGPKKSLKTSLLVDLALSLASGKRFLDKFDAPEQVRVLVLSGESGEATLKETALRVCVAKNLDLATLGNQLLWGCELPQLASADDLANLRGYLQKEGIGAAVIDPLYQCLTAGGRDVSAASIFDMGPLLLRAARSCLDASATPIFIHHARKTNTAQRASRNEPLDLDDMAFAGFAEFARQWLLVSRREPYEPGSGTHKLWLNVGGSAGHGGLWGVDVEEGAQNVDFNGRFWKASVVSSQDAIEQAKQQKLNKKLEKQDEDLAAARGKIISFLTLNPGGETTPGIVAGTGTTKRVVNEVLERMQQQGTILPTTVKKPAGRGERNYDAWKLGGFYAPPCPGKADCPAQDAETPSGQPSAMPLPPGETDCPAQDAETAGEQVGMCPTALERQQEGGQQEGGSVE